MKRNACQPFHPHTATVITRTSAAIPQLLSLLPASRTLTSTPFCQPLKESHYHSSHTQLRCSEQPSHELSHSKRDEWLRACHRYLTRHYNCSATRSTNASKIRTGLQRCDRGERAHLEPSQIGVQLKTWQRYHMLTFVEKRKLEWWEGQESAESRTYE